MLRANVVALIASLTFLVGCNPFESDNIKGDVIQKIPRPGNDVVAIVTEYNPDALSSFAYRVYLSVPNSERPPDEILLFHKGNPPDVVWKGKRALTLRVPCGQISRFTNFSYVWPKPGKDEVFERIVISLENQGVCKD